MTNVKRDKYVLFSRSLGKLANQVRTLDATDPWVLQVNGLVYRTMAEAGQDYFDFIDGVIRNPDTAAERTVSQMVKTALR